MCVKIVAECKEYELLETVAIQDTQDRVFLFIRCLYPDETRPETRKRPRSGLICAKRKPGSRRGFLRSRVRRYCKNLMYSFSWPVHSSLSLVESLTFSWYEFGIRWKPSDYSKRKRSILRVHHMKLHGKLNASVFFTRNRHIIF